MAHYPASPPPASVTQGALSEKALRFVALSRRYLELGDVPNAMSIARQGLIRTYAAGPIPERDSLNALANLESWYPGYILAPSPHADSYCRARSAMTCVLRELATGGFVPVQVLDELDVDCPHCGSSSGVACKRLPFHFASTAESAWRDSATSISVTSRAELFP